jgi:hypothetical protein
MSALEERFMKTHCTEKILPDADGNLTTIGEGQAVVVWGA